MPAMSTFISKKNLITAGGATGAAMVALHFTASKGTLVQGLAATAAVIVALPLIAKVAG